MVINCLGRSSDGGRPMCKLCGMTGADITRIKNHIESMHWQPQLRTTYSCEICGASCKTKHGLACHKSRHHSKKKMMLQQQAAAASMNGAAGASNLSTLAAAAAVQTPTAIINPTQSVVVTQPSAFSADSVALAALAAVKEPIPLQTNLARVGAQSKAPNTMIYNQQATVVMPGGAVANPAAAYIPIGGAIVAPTTQQISAPTLPITPQQIVPPQNTVQPVHKGYAAVSKPPSPSKKASSPPKKTKNTEPIKEEKDNHQTEDDVKPSTELKQESTISNKPHRKVGENPFVDEEVSNSPVPDPTPAESSRKAAAHKKSNKRKTSPERTEESESNFNIKEEKSDKVLKSSKEEIKKEAAAKSPKRTPTRSKRGRKRY